jgi:Tol biopolymer transport system component/DNA-binding winged helix-turn-helix (wHTH) protein
MEIETGKLVSYEFEGFRVEPEKRLLWRDESKIAITPKVFETLLIFLEHRGEVLEKDRLINLLWPDSFVEESNLAQNVAVLRKALGESSKQHRFILTIPGRGYRFVAEVKKIFAESENLEEKENHELRAADHKQKTEEKTEGPVVQTTNRKWLFLTVPLALVAMLVFGFWLFDDRDRTDETPVISKTTQITSWSGLDFYPSISADGNSIAFSSDRTGSFEIYVKRLVAGAREIQLTSDGGQNFQPAVSSDGNFVAYCSKKRGGIWIVPVTGGTQKQITDFGSRPTWSPDDSQIAFQNHPLNDLGYNARNAMPPSTVWLVPAKGGEPKQLTQAGNPAGGHGAPSWSPDGKRIVFDTSDVSSSKVWSVSVEGYDLKRISGKVDHATDAVFAPDGKSIYLVSDRGGVLQKVNVSETGEPIAEPVKIFDASGSRFRQLSIAARGKQIVYSALSTNSNLWEMPLARGEAIGNPVQLTQNATTRAVTPAFSPDGKKIAYCIFTTGAVQLWTMDSDGKNQTQSTATDGRFPWWFPDGKRIAFLTLGNNHSDFWSVAVDGEKEKKLFDFDEDVNAARLSPNGMQVAFTSKKSGTLNLWTISIEGGEPKQLTFDKESTSFPAWSPDGKWIAFQMKRGEDSHVGIAPGEGGAFVQLTFDKGQSWVHDWSPDGDKIIFAGQRDGLWNIYWVSRSTKEVKRLTNFTKLNSYVRFPAWSPLSDRIVYEYAETTGNIWMIELR